MLDAAPRTLDGQILNRVELTEEVDRLTGGARPSKKLRDSLEPCSSLPTSDATLASLPASASMPAAGAPHIGWADENRWIQGWHPRRWRASIRPPTGRRPATSSRAGSAYHPRGRANNGSRPLADRSPASRLTGFLLG